MKKILVIVFATCIALVWLYSGEASAQTDSTYYVIKTTDGNLYKGQVLNETDSLLYFLTYNLGEIRIIKRLVVSKVPLFDKKEKTKYWYTSPHNTRYLYLPNGYNLKGATGYYQNTWVLLNQASVGISDYFTVGLGVVPLFLFGADVVPIWVTPKFSVPVVKNKVNIGGGLMWASLLGERENFGLAYGVGTYGDPDNNITLGFGYAYADNEWGKSPAFSLAGLKRVNERIYLLSENYLFTRKYEDEIVSYDEFGQPTFEYHEKNKQSAIVSFGLRNVKPKLAIDYGLIIPINFDIDAFVAIPWLGLTVPFN